MSRFFKSFKFAANGLVQVFKSELNFKIHLLVTVVVVAASWYFDISSIEWVAIAICVGMVLFAELMNTAIEALVNLVSPEFNPKAGLIKDIAAAAVLILALTSFVVGLISFVPKIF